VLWFEKKGVDDPVGAISVHGVCGAWGTLAVAFFQREGFSLAQLGSQLLGGVTCLVWTFTTMTLVFRILKSSIGLRVDQVSELEGLDLSEHAAEAYPRDLTETTEEYAVFDAPGVPVTRA
jgi:Amt family ammonium transporter